MKDILIIDKIESIDFGEFGQQFNMSFISKESIPSALQGNIENFEFILCFASRANWENVHILKRHIDLIPGNKPILIIAMKEVNFSSNEQYYLLVPQKNTVSILNKDQFIKTIKSITKQGS